MISLDNGLAVAAQRVTDAPVVAIQAWVNAGAADETPDQAGVAHVFEHMVFRPATRGGSPLARAVEGVGGEVNAWTSLDQTVFHVVVPQDALEVGVAALGDALVCPRFDDDALDQERRVVLEELRAQEDAPARALLHEVFASAFLLSAYRRPVIGTAATIGALRARHLDAFFRRWYVARNTTLVVVGDVAAGRVERAARAHFGGMPARAAARARRTEPRQLAPRARLVHRPGPEARVALAFHAPPALALDAAALELAAAALGGDDLELGEVRVRHHGLRDGGLVVVDAAAAPGDEARTVTALARRVAAAPAALTTPRLEAARTSVLADRAFQRETVQGVARELGWHLSNAGDLDTVAASTGRVARADHADVTGAARRWLALDAATAVAVTPRRVTARGAAGRALLVRVPRRRAPAAPTPTPRATVAAAPAAVQPAPATPPQVIREVLPNGLTVLVRPDPSVPVVAMRAVWTGGTRLEDARTTGSTALLAALLVRGCGGRDAAAMAAAVEQLGGNLGAVAGRNSLAVRAEWMTASWERGFELLADCVARPRLDRAEITRERRAQLDRLAVEDGYPTQVAFRLFAETLYQQHPYRLHPLGTAAVVGALDRAALARLFAERYPLAGLTLAVVGDVDPAVVLARVRARLGAPSQPAPAPAAIAAEAFDGRPAAAREVYRYLDRQQSYVVVGFPGTTVASPDRFAVEILTQLLGGQSGRLFAELRDRQGLAYQLQMYGADGIDPGYLAVYAACAPENTDRVVAAIRAELERVVADGVTADEVERTRRRLVGGFRNTLQRRAAIANALAYHEAYDLGWQEWDRYPARLAAVTAADVTAAARAYLRWDRAVTAIVRPPAATPAAARRTAPVRTRRGR